MTTEWEQAVRRADVATLRRLLLDGADPDSRDQHGQTALMVASRDGHEEVVSLLLGHNADLDHTAKFHLTALMLATINGRVAIVRALVDAGADRTVRGTGAPGFHDRTALDLAIGPNRQALIEILQDPLDTPSR